MSRTRDSEQDQGPRLFVAFASDLERREVVASLPPSVTVVRRADVGDAVRTEVERRSEAAERVIGELEQEIRSVAAQQAASEGVHAGLIVELERTRDAADWCELQPALDAEQAGRIEAAVVTLEGHSRTVREANRRLERVLEQRATAEAALEEARGELTSLGAAGDDEPEVRRHMEAASRRVHEITAEHQRCMAEVEHRRAELRGIEEAIADRDGRGAPNAARDPLQSMRAAVNAKFSQGDGGVAVVDPEALDRARIAAADAESAADHLAQELTRARAAVASLEHELTVRTDDADSRAGRHRAAMELESQVSAVERQLGDAEGRARTSVDEATRELSRAELSLERLRHEGRDRRNRLRKLATLVPEAHRPDDQEDPVAHASVIARALRVHADAMQPDLDHASAAIERDRDRADELQVQLDARRSEVGVVLPQDQTGAIERFAAGALAVLLDDAVIAPGDEPTADAVECTTLLLADPATPMIVLTSDPSIVSWAIEQPADRAAVTSLATLREIGDVLADQPNHRP